MDFVNTQAAPAAIGPYSQATLTGSLVYTAGQVALDPASMEVVAGGVPEQTEQVMRNLAAILAAAGTDLSRVVKTTVFLVDMGDFAAMNEVWEAWVVPGHTPPRATVQAALARPDWKVEMVVTAAL